MRLFFIIFTFAIALTPVAHADSLSDATNIVISMSKIPSDSEGFTNSDKKNSPKNYKKEAKEFEKICRDDREMPLYFECGCLAKDYLHHRKELGPEAHSSAVRNQLGAKCKDASGIATQMEKKCLKDLANAPKGKDLEDFCECYGDKFGKLYEQTPGAINSRMKLSLMTRARLTCIDPALAAKRYGLR